MFRGWSWGNLGGDFEAKKQTQKKNIYLLTVTVHTAETIRGNRKMAEKRERQ